MMTCLKTDDGPEAMDFEASAAPREVRHAPNPRPWRWVRKPSLKPEPKPKGETNACTP